MILNLLTQNEFKVETAQQALADFPIKLRAIELNIPEIQADTNAEIARHSALLAAKQLNEPIAREDHGFYLNAFPQWPGPYMAHTETHLPAGEVLKMLDGNDRTGYFEIALAYAQPNGEVVEFIHQVPCQLAEHVNEDEHQFGWDGIIQFANDSRTFSEYPMEERYARFTPNFVQLAKYLTEKN